MGFKALGFTSAVKNFYEFLNEWGIGEAPPGIITIDNLCFSNEAANRGEEALTDEVRLLSAAMTDVKEIFTSAMGTSKQRMKTI